MGFGLLEGNEVVFSKIILSNTKDCVTMFPNTNRKVESNV